MKNMKETLKKLCRLKRLWILSAAPLACLLLLWAKNSEYFAEEIYAKRIFHVYSQVFSNLTGWLPFSLAELFVVLSPLLLLALLIYRIIAYRRAKGNRLFLLGKDIISLLCVASLAYFLLVLGCSINYYREPITKPLKLIVRDSTEDELYLLHERLVEETNRVRKRLLSMDEAGVFRLNVSKAELAKWCDEAFDALAEEYDIFHGAYPKPKRVFFSRAMSSTELTGVYVPFTMEANVNVDVPDYSIASTMCHELAHLRGFIREDEANFIAYLACLASDVPAIQYSGLMEALILSGNALFKKNSDRFYELRGRYDEGVSRDLADNSKYWQQFHDTKISRTTEKLNDTYLKANNQSDGVQSYGRMVDLLLAEERKHWLIDD